MIAEPIKRSAVFGHGSTHRYLLERTWAESRGTVGWVLLNPSVADDHRDDLTVTKCMRYADQWGYGGIAVANLCSYVATSPGDLFTCAMPNDMVRNAEHLARVVARCDLVVVGWGDNVDRLPPRRLAGAELVERFVDLASRHGRRRGIVCLGHSQRGNPRHPSRLGYDQVLEPWNRAA